jgi:hypothetical protein
MMTSILNPSKTREECTARGKCVVTLAHLHGPAKNGLLALPRPTRTSDSIPPPLTGAKHWGSRSRALKNCQNRANHTHPVNAVAAGRRSKESDDGVRPQRRRRPPLRLLQMRRLPSQYVLTLLLPSSPNYSFHFPHPHCNLSHRPRFAPRFPCRPESAFRERPLPQAKKSRGSPVSETAGSGGRSSSDVSTTPDAAADKVRPRHFPFFFAY